MSVREQISFRLNGRAVAAEIPLRMSTLDMLREQFELTGTKLGCGEGECGACTILVDGMSINSCLMFAVDCDGREIVTVEGLLGEEGLSLLQKEFVARGAVQCGFCTPGVVVQGAYLLRRNPAMTVEEIKRGIEGNLCRCTGYKKIIEAIASTLERVERERPGAPAGVGQDQP
jgi:carbon-monoxide dehydrogenase small subunit